MRLVEFLESVLIGRHKSNVKYKKFKILYMMFRKKGNKLKYKRKKNNISNVYIYYTLKDYVSFVILRIR